MERDTNEHDGKRSGYACRSLLETRFEGMEIRMEYKTLNHCLCGKILVHPLLSIYVLLFILQIFKKIYVLMLSISGNCDFRDGGSSKRMVRRV